MLPPPLSGEEDLLESNEESDLELESESVLSARIIKDNFIRLKALKNN
jgi:hypothetical protein